MQLDCDPAITTYNTLLKIPFDEHKFAVITFEHDHYHDEKSEVRKKCISLGIENMDVHSYHSILYSVYKSGYRDEDMQSMIELNTKPSTKIIKYDIER